MDALFDLLGSFFPFIILAIVMVTRIYALVQKAKKDSRKAPQDRSESGRQGETGTSIPFARNFQSWEDEFRDPRYLQRSSPRSAVTMEQGEQAAASAVAPGEDEGEGEEEFSAWNLSVDEPPPPPPVPKPARETPLQMAPDLQQVPLSRKSFSLPTSGPLFPELSQVSVTAVIPGGYTEPGDRAGAGSHAGADDRTGAGSYAGADAHAGTGERPSDPGKQRGEISGLSRPSRLRRPLTPLQQGMVWAEILGPPKGM